MAGPVRGVHSTPVSRTTSPLLDDRYLLLETLGRGGMGVVLRAFDRQRERFVAVKVLHRASRGGPAHPLCAEFDSWSRLRHPNIVRALELGMARRGPLERDTPYLVMELVRALPSHPRPGVGDDTLRGVAAGALAALEHVHDAGLVHRDVKPGNVLLRPRAGAAPVVKLTDFGLAAAPRSTGRPGEVSGSFAYLAPEVLLGLPVDGRADLYALGVLLHRMATGRLPFSDTSLQGLVRGHLTGARVELRRLRPDLSGELCAMVDAMLARDPSDRPASARAALQSLAGPVVPRRRSPIVGRFEGVELRLALDAARLGGSRLLLLPRGRTRLRSALLREMAVRAPVLGISVARVTSAKPCGRGSIGAVVLSLLGEHGTAVGRLLARHRLHHGLPLGVVRGLPVWDRSAPCTDPGPVPARGVASFVLECASRRPMVLVVTRTARAGRLVEEVVRHLVEDVERSREPRADRGGLVLAIDPGAATDELTLEGCHESAADERGRLRRPRHDPHRVPA